MDAVGRQDVKPVQGRGLPSLATLLSLSARDLDQHDIAVVNLLCATGLPGAEGLDVAKCIATLDHWAKLVERYAEKSLPNFQRNPTEYFGHEGFCRFLAMVTQLKHPNRLGVEYQPTAIGNYIFADSRDDLLHGVLTRKLGTCTSLPVLFVAIGRRLGWPMYLAIAKGHVLCQWLNVDFTHRNLEGSCPGGGNSFPDAHYHSWPRRLTRDELASGRYLKPLTRAEEFALFLETRGHCLVDNRRFAEARDAYAHARRFAPQWSDYKNHLYSLELHEALARRGVQPSRSVSHRRMSDAGPILCIPGLTC